MNIIILIAVSYVFTYQNGTIAILPKAIIKSLVGFLADKFKIIAPIPYQNTYKWVSIDVCKLITYSIDCNFCFNFWLGYILFFYRYGIIGLAYAVLYSVLFNKIVQKFGLDTI